MKALKIVAAVAALAVGLLLVAVTVVALRFDPENYKGELQALVKEKTGRTLTMEGPLRLSFFPKLAVEAERLRLSEAGSERPFAQVGDIRLSLALMPLLSQKLVVDRVTLSGVSAEVVRRKDGRTSIDDLTGGGGATEGKAAEKGGRTPLVLDVSGVDVGVDKLVWRDERDGGEWRITAAKLETGRIADDAPGKLKLAARIDGSKPAIRADIDLSSAYRFNFSRQTASLTDLELRVAGDLPSMKGVKLSVDGRLDTDWGKGTAGGALTAKFDESTLKAKFDLGAAQAKGAPAVISFDADVDRLDLDRYQAAGGGQAEAGKDGKAVEKSGGKPQPEQPLDLEGLKALNLKGQLRVGELRVAKLKLEKVQLGLRAAGGRLDMNPVAANLYGGTLAGSAGVNALNYQFTLKQQLTGIDIGPLLRDAAGKDLLEGRGKVAVDVQTAGRTTSALRKALGGSASLALTDGALKGINLAEALRKAKAALGSKSAEQAASKGDKTDFSELTASFAIRNGVAHNEDLSMKSPFIRLGGAGDLDIGENRMNYLAKASVVNTSAGQGGKELESLSGLTVPVRVSGPFENLGYRIEIGSLVSDSVKQKVQEKVQETVKERVQDRLKGLLKR